jgi:molecular chaperone GrpE (heat shock protein)
VIGKTVPDTRLHEVTSASSNSRYPNGTIINIVQMGYVNRLTNEVAKAQVIINRLDA